jgi:hypothetical protein
VISKVVLTATIQLLLWRDKKRAAKNKSSFTPMSPAGSDGLKVSSWADEAGQKDFGDTEWARRQQSRSMEQAANRLVVG